MPPAERVSFNSDWEGPWVTADHAYEVIARGVPEGRKIFSNSSEYVISQIRGARLYRNVSEFDDYQFHVKRRPGYETGDTLALVAPFLPAFGLDSRFVEKVANDNANFIPGALSALETMRNIGWKPNIISTSYEQYVYLTACKMAGVPMADIYCTKFPIDEYSSEITEDDKRMVRKKAAEIAKLPKLGITDTTRPEDVTLEAMKSIKFLDEFYWDQLPKTSFNRLVNEIKPIGGTRKYDALMKSVKADGCRLSESVTVGDSITDMVMLEKTRDAGGLAMSFNGNGYAVRNANVAVMSPHCMTPVVLTDVFARGGLEAVESIAKSWEPHNLHDLVVNGNLSMDVYKFFSETCSALDNGFPVVRWLDNDNLEPTIAESKIWRKSVRGTHVGSLG